MTTDWNPMLRDQFELPYWNDLQAFVADEIAERDPTLSGDEVYERARQIVGAQMQVVTYEEFLPTLLGTGALEPYDGYDPNVDASISNVFSGAVFRLGHSMLSGTLLRVDEDGNEIAEGHLPLRDAFFAPSRILEEGGIVGEGFQFAEAVEIRQPPLPKRFHSIQYLQSTQ